MALPSVMMGAPINARGAVASAPLNSTLPNDATSDLDTAFETVGLIGEEGFEVEPTRETTEIPAWGGYTARELTSKFSETIRFTMLESAEAEVLKLVYGEKNVTVSPEGAISIAHNATMPAPRAWSFTMKDGDGRRRVVAGNGQLKLAGSIQYVHSDAIKYQVEITCLVDDNDNTTNEYLGEASVVDEAGA